MDPTPLSRAPIVEGLLDIRVQPAEGVTIETVAGMRELLGPDYPEMMTRYRVIQPFDLTGDAPPIGGTRELDSYAFHSSDKRRVLQVQPGGFTLSILKPYKDWDELRDEAKARWAQYVNLTNPKRATRIGARFINRIEIPLPADLKDWLLTFPEIGQSLPQMITEHMMRVVIPLRRGTGIVTQMIEPGTHTQQLPLILDVDAFLDAEFTPTGNVLWEAVEELREAKNLLFFGSITDRMGDLYK